MSSIRVVLDTNLIVSALLKDEGYERYVLDLVFRGKLQIALSMAVLDEYESVLRRPKFRFAPRVVTGLLRRLRRLAVIIHPQRELNIAEETADNRFLECAESARATYLVTGNKRHFPISWRQTIVVNARELLEWTVPELRR